MAGLSLKRAKREVRSLIARFQGRRATADPKLQKLTAGKLYELLVVGRTLQELRARGFNISLVGSILDLKQGPGLINAGDTHFRIEHPASGQVFNLYTDVEVRTLGSALTGSAGLCSYHEVDIVIVSDGVTGRPQHDELALGVECKSNANFTKSIIKEALGVKRELSLLVQSCRMSTLALAARQMGPVVPSEPPLEFWLCYVDPKGNQYSVSPSAFGIEFKNWAA